MPARTPASGRSATAVPERTIRSWPLILLAAPASVAVWSGWVGIGRMTGFGQVHPLPGIWDSFHLDSAITLPIGVEAYAAYALRAWLSTDASVKPAARCFARWSAIASLLLGMAGQVAYHLLTQAGTVRAPWEITTAVSCLPVLVLGMGTALAHLLHAAPRTGTQIGPVPGDVPDRAVDRESATWNQDHPGPDCPAAPNSRVPAVHRDGSRNTGWPDQEWPLNAGPGQRGHWSASGPVDRRRRGPDSDRQARLDQARAAASQLTASGGRVSRRGLRALGVKGSNADLSKLARIVSSELASTCAPGDA